jgi:hypothetical protein
MRRIDLLAAALLRDVGRTERADENAIHAAIEAKTETYRVELGLPPWPAHGGRRSGRTTRMMLTAIATVAVTNQRVFVTFDPSPMSLHRGDLFDLARRFGVDTDLFTVETHEREERRNYAGHSDIPRVFRDHFDSRYRWRE